MEHCVKSFKQLVLDAFYSSDGKRGYLCFASEPSSEICQAMKPMQVERTSYEIDSYAATFKFYANELPKYKDSLKTILTAIGCQVPGIDYKNIWKNLLVDTHGGPSTRGSGLLDVTHDLTVIGSIYERSVRKDVQLQRLSFACDVPEEIVKLLSDCGLSHAKGARTGFKETWEIDDSFKSRVLSEGLEFRIKEMLRTNDVGLYSLPARASH